MHYSRHSIASDSTLFQSKYGRTKSYKQCKKGTSEAKPLSASFFRSNLTCTATYVELVDNDNIIENLLSIIHFNSANTWERRTVTFPADTTGPFDDDNAFSLQFLHLVVAGSNYTGGTLATTWEGSMTNANRAVGITIILCSSTDRISSSQVFS